MSVNKVENPVSGQVQSIDDAVKALLEASQRLQEDPQVVESVETLIQGLKQLHTEETETYRFKRPNYETRRKLDSLWSLIGLLESQVERAKKVARRRGMKYYLARISNTVRGNEIGRIANSMESELRSWLDQQDIEQLAKALGNESEEVQMKAISTIESIVRKGYDRQLQEAILSCSLVEKLGALLELNGASWGVQKEAAFALSALVDFNKDIFVSLVLMIDLVEKLLAMLGPGSEDPPLVATCMLTRLISTGKGVITDEIQSKGGVQKIVDLLDDKPEPLQHAAMDCVFEMAYHGRLEVVEAMLKLDVMRKLASLQHSGVGQEQKDLVVEIEKLADYEVKDRDSSSQDTQEYGHSSSLQKCRQYHPFSNAVARFALQLGIGTGLRRREKRALKQEILKRVKEVMPNDTEVANITAEVLWAP